MTEGKLTMALKAKHNKKVVSKLGARKKEVDPSLIAAKHETNLMQGHIDPTSTNNFKKVTNQQTDKSFDTDENAGQLISSNVKSTASENTYDVSHVSTSFFNNHTYSIDSSIASSASSDSSNNNWKKYIFYTGAGVGLIGAGVLIANSGGGGGSSPAPTPHVSFNNFTEFCASSSFLSPTILNLSSSDSYSYDIDHGYSRPGSYSSTFFNAMDYVTSPNLIVGADGLRVNLNAQSVEASVDVVAYATDDASEVIWMEELSINSTSNNTDSANAYVNVSASANAAADAEVGICDLSITLDSENASGVAILDANASYTSYATVIAHDINIDVHTSGSSYAAVTANDRYLANGAYLGDVLASGYWGSVAEVLLKNITLSHESTSEEAAQASTVSSGYSNSLGAYAALGSNATLEISGNLNINATNSGAGDAYASALTDDIIDWIPFDDATIRAASYWSSSADVSIGAIAVNAETEGAGLARATFAQNNANYYQTYFTGEGAVSSVDLETGSAYSFYAGIQATARGEDYFGAGGAKSNVSIDSINVESNAALAGAEAYFVAGDAGQVIDAGVVATTYGSETESTVYLGGINITASAKGDSSAGLVQANGADIAKLEIKSVVNEDYYGGYNSAYDSIASVNVGDINIGAESVALNSDSEAFLVTGGLRNAIEISAYHDPNNTHSSSTVEVGNISVSAEALHRNSNVQAFGVGSLNYNQYGNIDFNARASFNVNLSNYASDNVASVTLGDLNFTASVINPNNTILNNANNSSAKAFVAGNLNTDASDNTDLYYDNYNRYDQNANFSVDISNHDLSEGVIDIGNISLSASTNGVNSDAQAFVAGLSNNQTSGWYYEYDTGYSAANTESYNRSDVNLYASSSDLSKAELNVGDIAISAETTGNLGSASAFLSGHVVATNYTGVHAFGGTVNVTGTDDTYRTVTTYARSYAEAIASVDIESFANGHGNADILVGNIDVLSDSRGHITGNNAEAFMAGFATANATAYAHGELQVHGVTDGNISSPDYVSADVYNNTKANAYAYAGVSISASASDNATTNIEVGNISIEAHAGEGGNALAFMAGFADASAHATSNGDANSWGANIDNYSSVNNDDRQFTYSEVNIDFTVDATDFSTASVTIGDINIEATSAGGLDRTHTDAFMGGYGEYVYVSMSAESSDYGTATLNIGNINVDASKTNGVGDVNAFIAGQSENLGWDTWTPYKGDNYAQLHITASASDYSTSAVNIGDISVAAASDQGPATAALVLNNMEGYADYNVFKSSFLNISAYAIDDSDATVTINSIDVTASSEESKAIAALAYASNGNVAVELSAFATAETGTAGSISTLNITDGIHISADAKGDAGAYMAYGPDGYYRNGFEHGHDDQNRSGSFISAYATEYATATVNIGGIDITANSSHGSAEAGFTSPYGDNGNDSAFAIRAYSDTFYDSRHNWIFTENLGWHYDLSDMPAEAHVNIDYINVEASAFASAYASIDTITAYAHNGGTSTVDIGNINVTADGSAKNIAFINKISSYAAEFGDSHVTLKDVTVAAGNANAFSAYAAANFNTEANWNANATMDVGNISVTSEASGLRGSSSAQLYIEANASDYSSAAFVGGNLNLSAQGLTYGNDFASLTLYANENDWGSDSSIKVDDITFTAQTDTNHYPDIHLNIYADTDYSQLSTIETGNITVNIEGQGQAAGWVNIGDDANNYDQVTIGNFNGFVESANSHLDVDTNRIEWDQNRVATFSGLGSVDLNMEDRVSDGDSSDFQFAFGKIDVTDLSGSFSMNLGGWTNSQYIANDRDVHIPEVNTFTFEESIGTPSLVPNTTIYGYDISGGNTISFNQAQANDWQFYDINNGSSPETNANDLWIAISNAFSDAYDNWFDYDNDGTPEDYYDGPSYLYSDYELNDNVYVYSVFDETNGGSGPGTDLNGDGIYSERLGVLAYDQEISDGYLEPGHWDGGTGGLTALVFLNDINGTLTEDSISGSFIG